MLPKNATSALPLSAILSALAVALPSVRAELVIKPDDIKNGRYNYTLKREDLKTLAPTEGKLPGWETQTFDNKFLDDLHSFSNIRTQGGAWAYVGMKPGTSAAEFVYKFDFSALKLRPTSFRMRETVRFEQDGDSYPKRAKTGFTSAYRIGGDGEWIKINEAPQEVGFRGDKEYMSQPIKLPADSKASTLYIKTELTSNQPILGRYLKKGQNGANPDRGGPLWNLTRADQPDRYFQIMIDVAPAK